MSQRYSIADLADALSQRSHLPKRETADFVRLFFEQIEACLLRENVVKVRGLGTFKLVEVDARQSVDVNSGQSIEIEGHTRVVFVPDALLRDAVNKPFAEFETVVLNERTSTADMESLQTFDSDPADADADDEEPVAAETAGDDVPTSEPIAAEPQEVAATPVEDEVVSQPSVDAEPAEVEAPKPAEVVATEEPEQEVTAAKPEPETAEVDVAVVHNAKVVEDAQLVQHAQTVAHTVSSHPHHFAHLFLGALTAVLLLAVGYFLGYYVRPIDLPAVPFPRVAHQAETHAPKVPEVKVVHAKKATRRGAQSKPQSVTSQRAAAVPSDTVKVNRKSVVQKPQVPSEVLAYPQLEDGDYLIVGIRATEKMTPGKTLLNLSLKYYRTKDMVPYICVLNNIKNPDIVALNRDIKIPELKHK